MALTIVPQAGQTLLQTRDPIANNFSLIDTAFSVNHVDYGNANQGKHNFVSLPYQSAAPATAASEMALYTQAGTLYLCPQNSGAAVPIGGPGQAGLANTGWTILPSGLIMVWGLLQPTLGVGTFLFSGISGFTGFTSSPYSVQLTYYGQSGSVGYVASTGFTQTAFSWVLNVVSGSSPSAGFYFLIVGS